MKAGLGRKIIGLAATFPLVVLSVCAPAYAGLRVTLAHTETLSVKSEATPHVDLVKQKPAPRHKAAPARNRKRTRKSEKVLASETAEDLNQQVVAKQSPTPAVHQAAYTPATHVLVGSLPYDPKVWTQEHWDKELKRNLKENEKKRKLGRDIQKFNAKKLGEAVKEIAQTGGDWPLYKAGKDGDYAFSKKNGQPIQVGYIACVVKVDVFGIRHPYPVFNLYRGETTDYEIMADAGRKNPEQDPRNSDLAGSGLTYEEAVKKREIFLKNEAQRFQQEKQIRLAMALKAQQQKAAEAYLAQADKDAGIQPKAPPKEIGSTGKFPHLLTLKDIQGKALGKPFTQSVQKTDNQTGPNATLVAQGLRAKENPSGTPAQTAPEKVTVAKNTQSKAPAVTALQMRQKRAARDLTRTVRQTRDAKVKAPLSVVMPDGTKVVYGKARRYADVLKQRAQMKRLRQYAENTPR